LSELSQCSGGKVNEAALPVKKAAALCSAAKFREETSKKAGGAVRDRIAAETNVAG
jgi:hypothetical protein